MPKPRVVSSDRLEVDPDTDPRSVARALRDAPAECHLQFSQPLPAKLLAATAEAILQRPSTTLRAYGRAIEPGLGWLKGFAHLRRLQLNLWNETSFEALRGLVNLEHLSLGDTASRAPSLMFLDGLGRLSRLYVEGHGKSFESVGHLPELRHLGLRASRAKSLEPIQYHQRIEVLTINFGGLRDFSALATMPMLRGVELYQVRNFNTEDLEPLGDCSSLEATSLGALRNVKSLATLGRAPANSLRYLLLEGMKGLTSFSGLERCERLEQLGLYDSKPKDVTLEPLLDLPSLGGLIIGDPYPRKVIEDFAARYTGSVLRYRDEVERGPWQDLKVRWRGSVESCLT